MDKKLKILQVSPEVGPFARTGGLADVVWALSKELRALGHDVRVAMPRYNLLGQQGAFESGVAKMTWKVHSSSGLLQNSLLS